MSCVHELCPCHTSEQGPELKTCVTFYCSDTLSVRVQEEALQRQPTQVVREVLWPQSLCVCVCVSVGVCVCECVPLPVCVGVCLRGGCVCVCHSHKERTDAALPDRASSFFMTGPSHGEQIHLVFLHNMTTSQHHISHVKNWKLNTAFYTCTKLLFKLFEINVKSHFRLYLD